MTTKQRPVRRMPDGRYGVVYRGAVYPLVRGREIQLRGSSFDPEACTSLRTVPLELQERKALVIHLDVSGRYTYLMLSNCTESDVDRLVEMFQSDGVRVLSYGASARPADDGVQYEWYIRADAMELAGWTLRRAAVGDTQVGGVGVEGMLRGGQLPGLPAKSVEAGAEPITSEDVLERQSTADSALARRVHELEEGLARTEERAESEIRELRQASLAAKEALQVEISKRRVQQMAMLAAREESRRFKEALEQVASSGTTTVREATELHERILALSAERDALRDQRDAAESARLSAEALGNQYAEEASRTAEVAATVGERCEDAEALVEELRVANERLVTQQQRGTKEFVRRLGGFLEACYPDAKFLRDSLEVFIDDISDRRSVCAVLSELSFRRSDVKGEKVEGTQTWKEKRFSTGTAHDGRAYYRYVGPCLEVLLSRKARQSADVAWLRAAE